MLPILCEYFKFSIHKILTLQCITLLCINKLVNLVVLRNFNLSTIHNNTYLQFFFYILHIFFTYSLNSNLPNIFYLI